MAVAIIHIILRMRILTILMATHTITVVIMVVTGRTMLPGLSTLGSAAGAVTIAVTPTITMAASIATRATRSPCIITDLQWLFTGLRWRFMAAARLRTSTRSTPLTEGVSRQQHVPPRLPAEVAGASPQECVRAHLRAVRSPAEAGSLLAAWRVEVWASMGEARCPIAAVAGVFLHAAWQAALRTAEAVVFPCMAVAVAADSTAVVAVVFMAAAVVADAAVKAVSQPSERTKG